MFDNNKNVNIIREKYREFIYDSYSINEDDKYIYLSFRYIISGLCSFEHKLNICKKNYIKEKIKNNLYFENIVFNIGMIELVNYWKSCFCYNLVVKCGELNDDQINWWKKIYYNGLGELRYRNNIRLSIDEFINIKSYGNSFSLKKLEDKYDGYLVPIGGGKDSIVTLNTLDIDKDRDYAIIANPKDVCFDTCYEFGFSNNNIIEIYRVIDKKLIELNDKGFINGHVPISSVYSFLCVMMGYLVNRKYVALSNEDSANEKNEDEWGINHQYSKSFEYENDFRYYVDKYLYVPVYYFSFLRPLNEFLIAKIFSRLENYHKIFKSCNLGSKNKKWEWCLNCPKCMFVFTILSPFLYKDKLINIFGEDMFERKDMLDTFIDLTGYGKLKPFECVGTFEEVRYAISLTIKNIGDSKMPYLLDYYKKHYKLEYGDIENRWNSNNNLNEEQEGLLRSVL